MLNRKFAHRYAGTSIAIFGTVLPTPDNESAPVTTYTLDTMSPVKDTAPRMSTPTFGRQFYTSPQLDYGQHSLVVGCTTTSPSSAFYFDYLVYTPSTFASPSSSTFHDINLTFMTDTQTGTSSEVIQLRPSIGSGNTLSSTVSVTSSSATASTSFLPPSNPISSTITPHVTEASYTRTSVASAAARTHSATDSDVLRIVLPAIFCPLCIVSAATTLLLCLRRRRRIKAKACPRDFVIDEDDKDDKDGV